MKFADRLSRFVFGLVCALVAVSLTACDVVEPVVDDLVGKITPTSIEEARADREANITPSVSYPTIVQDGYLTVGLDTTSTAPLNFINSSGDTVGIDVDLAYALAQELGLKVHFVPVAGVAGAAESAIDIMMGAQFGISPNISVVGDYAERAIAFYHQGEQAVVSTSDLAGKSCGVQGGSASERALNLANISMEQVQYSNLNEAFDALATGQVDYVLCDAYSGAYLAATYDGISCAGCIDTPEIIGVGVDATNVELQSELLDAMGQIMTNGVGELARTRWVGSLTTLTQSDQIAGISTTPETPTVENEPAPEVEEEYEG